MEEQERHTDRFLRSKKIEKHKKKSKLFFYTMPYLSAYLHESLDFFKVGIFGHMNKSGGGNQLYRGLGSIDIAAAARSILMVSRDKEEPWKRYMFPVKSSLAPEGEPIGFELDKKKGFRWIGKCQINVEELLNVEKSTGKKDIAVEYLQKLLSVEDLASTYIYEKMKEYGIAKRTVQEAKKISEIKAYKKGKIWYWHMEVGDSI